MDNQTSEGLVADATMSTAEFMGFSRHSGLGLYKSVSLVANACSIFRMFRRPKLTMKIVGYGVKAKIIFDLMSINDTASNE